MSTEWSMVTRCLIGVGVGLLLLLFGGVAHAEPASFTVSGTELTLAEQDDGSSTADVTVTNVTDGPARLAVALVAEDRNCSAVISPAEVGAARAVKATITLTACDVPESGKDLRLSAGAQTIDLVALPDAGAGPLDWGGELRYFLISAVLSALLLAGTFVRWHCCGEDVRDVPKKPKSDAADRSTPDEAQVDAARHGLPLSPGKYVITAVTEPATATAPSSPVKHKKRCLGSKLPGLGSDWSFKDSWASTVTLVTAAFAGVFGSKDVLPAIVGSADTVGPLAIITVASAIALGIVGTSPLLLQGLRSKDGENTVLGLLLASLATITATGGELGVIIDTTSGFAFPAEVKQSIVVLGVIAAAVLALYAVRSVAYNLRKGQRDPVKQASAPAFLLNVQYLPDGSDDRPSPNYVPEMGWYGIPRTGPRGDVEDDRRPAALI